MHCYLLVTTLLFVMSFTTSLAQKNMKSGYIIGLSGDTTQGSFVFDNKWKNPDSIYFISKSHNVGEYIKPATVRALAVDRYKYVSASLNKSDIFSGEEKFLFENESKVPVFLTVYFDGKKSLYGYFDRDNKQHLFIGDEHGYTKLLYNEYIEKSADVSGIVANRLKKNEKYKGQLILYFSDCERVRTSVASLGYSASDISKLFKSYYNCIDEKPLYQLEKEKPVLKVGVSGGATYTNFHVFDPIIGGPYEMVARACYDASARPTAGISAELVLPRNNNRWSLIAEARHTSFSITGDYTQYVDDDQYWYYTTELKYSFISTGLMLRYAIPVGRIRVFLAGGVRVNLAFEPEYNITRELHSYGDVTVMEHFVELPLKKREDGFLVGFGVEKGLFSFETKYGFGNGLTDTNRFGTNMKQFTFIFGLRIFELSL